MGGSPDGSKEKAKMDLFTTGVVTGKHGNGENGTDVLIYLENLTKSLLIPLKDP